LEQIVHALVYFLLDYWFGDHRLIFVIVKDFANVGDHLGSLVDFLGCPAQVPGVSYMLRVLSTITFEQI